MQLSKFHGKVRDVEVFRNVFGNYCVKLKYNKKEITLFSKEKIAGSITNVKYRKIEECP